MTCASRTDRLQKMVWAWLTLDIPSEDLDS
jgi:hypothetical protein